MVRTSPFYWASGKERTMITDWKKGGGQLIQMVAADAAGRWRSSKKHAVLCVFCQSGQLDQDG